MSPDTRWFQDAIRAKGYSQRGFAKLIPIDHAALSLMLHGKRKMSVHEAAEIANLLGKPVEEILNRIGATREKPVMQTYLVVTKGYGSGAWLINAWSEADARQRVYACDPGLFHAEDEAMTGDSVLAVIPHSLEPGATTHVPHRVFEDYGV